MKHKSKNKFTKAILIIVTGTIVFGLISLIPSPKTSFVNKNEIVSFVGRGWPLQFVGHYEVGLDQCDINCSTPTIPGTSRQITNLAIDLMVWLVIALVGFVLIELLNSDKKNKHYIISFAIWIMLVVIASLIIESMKI